MKRSILLLVVLGVFTAQSTLAAVMTDVVWTDWTAATSAGTANTADGTLAVYGTSIDVDFSGDISFSQLGTGTNYWTEPNPSDRPYTEFLSTAPTAAEMIALDYASTNTISFSNPIYKPVMAIVSLGRNALPVQYDFDQSFSVLSEGQGFWGNGTYTLLAGDILQGNEFHGVIQFDDWVSSISWTNSPNEYWHGVTFGAPVPEPSTFILLGVGLTGLVFVVRRRKNV